MIVRAADGLPQDTRNANWPSYWLNYRLNYHAQLLAQLLAQLQNMTTGWLGEGSAVWGGKHSVCVCVRPRDDSCWMYGKVGEDGLAGW